MQPTQLAAEQLLFNSWVHLGITLCIALCVPLLVAWVNRKYQRRYEDQVREDQKRYEDKVREDQKDYAAKVKEERERHEAKTREEDLRHAAVAKEISIVARDINRIAEINYEEHKKIMYRLEHHGHVAECKNDGCHSFRVSGFTITND